VTVGQSLGSHLVIGSTLKLEWAKSNTRGDLDVGAMATFGLVRLGIVMRDVTAPEFGSGNDTLALARRARAGVAVLSQNALYPFALDVDADLSTAIVDGHEERDLSAGAETWIFNRRIGVRGGVGKNTANEGGSFGAVGLSVAPYPRFFVEGFVTRGESGIRNRWGIDLRFTF
jgi:hypothetical protein